MDPLEPIEDDNSELEDEVVKEIGELNEMFATKVTVTTPAQEVPPTRLSQLREQLKLMR